MNLNMEMMNKQEIENRVLNKSGLTFSDKIDFNQHVRAFISFANHLKTKDNI